MSHRMHRSHRTTARTGVALAAVLALALLAAPAVAEEDLAEAEIEEAGEETSRFSGALQLDITNAYFFRGILQEREGFIAQPWTELYVNLFSSEDGPIRDVTIGGGVWASWHSEKTLAEGKPSPVYEVDLYPLLSVEFPYGLTWTTIYYFYTSPNDAFASVEELNLKLEWDDSEVLGRFALAPWVNLAIETHRTSFGPFEGEGLQFGIEPTLYESESDRYPLTLTLPGEIGLTIDDYYENDSGGENTFGYGSLGLLASLPITSIPEDFGAWAVSLGARYFFFSSTLEEANRGRSTYPVGTLSLGVEF